MEYIVLAFISVVIIAGIGLFIFNNINRWRFNKKTGEKKK
jgi:Flp pilus assembly pilin Flp